MLIQYPSGRTEVQGFTSDVKKVYLGTRELSNEEIKYINDTEFWNKVENIKLLKDLEEELKKFN